MSGSAKFIIGILLFVGLLALANYFKHSAIEAELNDKAVAALAEAEVRWAGVTVEGRNATLTGIAPSQAAGDAAVDLIGGLFGIHSAAGDFTVLEVVSPFLWSADYDGKRLALTGVAPTDEAMQAVMKRAKARFSDVPIVNEMRLAGGAPGGDWSGSAMVGLDQLAKLSSGSARLLNDNLTISGNTEDAATIPGIQSSLSALPSGFSGSTDITVTIPDTVPEPPAPLAPEEEAKPPVIVPAEAQVEIDRCQARIDDIMTGQTINFRTGSAEVIPQPNPLIKSLASVAKECPTTRIVISGHTDSVGDADANQILSKARAQAVVNLLVDEGVPADRLEAQGFGASRPIADNTTPEGRSANRRIEFRVLYAGTAE